MRCPAALEMMNEEALAHPDILFIACAFSLGEGNEKEVTQRVPSWENLVHVFMDEETKELVKARFDIMSVPYSIAISKVIPLVVRILYIN